MKKILTTIFALALLIMGGFGVAHADITNTFWNQTSPNVLMTNTGNGLANATIRVGACYIGATGTTPCGGGGSSDITIGNPVIGGTPNRVLFIDANGDVADSGDFTFDSIESALSVGTSGTNLMVSPTLDSIQLEAPAKFKAISSNVTLDVSGQTNSVVYGDTELAFGAGRVKLDNNANTFTYDNSNGLLLYSDLSQNIFRAGTQTGTDDVLLDINATTRNIGLTVNDTTNNLLTGITIDGNDEANLVMFDVGTGMGAGFFVTNTAGVFSSDMGWSDGIGSASDFIAAPLVASMSVTDGSDVTSFTVNPAQMIAKGKLFQVDSIIDRPIFRVNPQTQTIDAGDLTNSYSDSTLTFNSDSSTSLFLLNIKGNATTTVSSFGMNPVDGNVLSWDSDTTDDVITHFYQGNNLMGSGVIGSAITYANTDGGANLIVGDASGIGGQDYTYILGSNEDAGDQRSASIFGTFETGILLRYEDASNYSGALTLLNNVSSLSYNDNANTTQATIFAASTEAVIGYQNAAAVSTSFGVQDAFARLQYNGNNYVEFDGSSQSLKLGGVTAGDTIISVNSSTDEIRLTSLQGSGQTVINNSANEEFGRWDYTAGSVALGDIGITPTATGYSMLLDYANGNFGIYNGIAGNPTLQSQMSGYFFAGAIANVYGAIDPANNDVRFVLNNTAGSFQVRNASLSLLSVDPLNQQSYLGSSSQTYVRTDMGTNVITLFGGKNDPTIQIVAYGTTTNLVRSNRFTYVEGSTGATAVNLPTTPVVGDIQTVCDTGLLNAANNITIDAGSGKAIVSTVSAQTYVNATPGQCNDFHYYKVNTWKIE